MNVLHVQRVSGIGGSERHLLALLPALAARGVDVRMCVLATGDAGRFVDGLSGAGVAMDVVPAGPDVNPAAVARLTATIRRHRPDLVHTHLIHGDTHGQAAARLAGVAAVSTFHASPPLYEREPYRTAARLAGKTARRTIAISSHLGRYLVDQRLTPPDRVRVIHYGMDTTGWRLTEGERAAARAAYGLAEDDLAVGVASRLMPEKGHADLIDAMGLAVGGAATAGQVGPGPRLRLLVAGAGPLRAELEARAAAALPPGSYRFLGFVADIRVFLGACDVFVFPTTPGFGEGFGMAMLEASAAGVPVVGTDVGPIPEVVADGKTGLIVPARSPARLAEAIVRLAGDGGLRRRLGEGGARRAAAEFGLGPMADRTRAVYEDIVGRG